MVTKCVICKAPHPQGLTLQMEAGEYFICSTNCYRESVKLGYEQD